MKMPLIALLLLAPTLAGAQEPCDSVRVLVAYYSHGGSTARMAQEARRGAASVAGARVTLQTVDRVTAAELKAADAVLIGSPTYYANMAGPVKTFIDDWGLRYHVFMEDKVGGAFATGADDGGGKEHTVTSLLLAMLNGGMVVVGPVYPDLGYGLFGASATTGSPAHPVPSDVGLKAARRLGERVASVAKRMCGAQK
jgi:NAD(P)H dehydrogenase (quinone)